MEEEIGMAKMRKYSRGDRRNVQPERRRLEEGIVKGEARGIAKGCSEGKFENMLKVFLKLIAGGGTFDEAANIAATETTKKIKYLRNHYPLDL